MESVFIIGVVVILGDKTTSHETEISLAFNNQNLIHFYEPLDDLVDFENETQDKDLKHVAGFGRNPRDVIAQTGYDLSTGVKIKTGKAATQISSQPIKTISNSLSLFSYLKIKTSSNVQRPDKYDSSLMLLLTTIVKKDLQECDFIVLIDTSFLHMHSIMWTIWLHNVKQVNFFRHLKGLQNEVSWTSPVCQVIMFFLSEATTFLDFGNESLTHWNYGARIIVVGLTRKNLELFTQTKKARKTEQILGIVKGKKEGHFHLYMNELYWGGRGVAEIALWKGRSFTKKPNFFPDRISDLQNANLNVITFEFPPAIIYRRSRNGTLLHIYGLDVSVVRALARVFNFTAVFKEPGPGELWGERLPNGTWNGMVGLLGSGEGDLGIANLFITAIMGRREFQEFSAPFKGDRSCVITRTAQPLPLWQSPSLPFQPSTWISMLIGLILSGPILTLLSKANAKIGHEHPGFQSLYYSSLYTYGVHFSTPIPKRPLRASTKIFIAFMWIYAIILITAYSSNLTAFLTVSRQPPSIETFRDLYRSNLKVLGQGPFFKNSMAQSENQYIKSLADRFFSQTSLDLILKDVLAGKAVMIQARGYLEFYSSQMKSASGEPLIRIMRECFSPYSVGIAYQSHSPLKEKFDRAITWMFESGLVRRWFLESISIYQRYQLEDRMAKDPLGTEEVYQAEESGQIPLGIDHMQGVFIIYVIGCLLSMISFVVEFFCHQAPK